MAEPLEIRYYQGPTLPIYMGICGRPALLLQVTKIIRLLSGQLIRQVKSKLLNLASHFQTEQQDTRLLMYKNITLAYYNALILLISLRCFHF